MGHIRTLLAILVVSFHAYHAGAHDVLPWFAPDGRVAVQLFYVISGFYMALILNRKYKDFPGANRLFYSNRILRLWPPILVVNALVLISFIVFDQVVLFNLDKPLPEAAGLLAGLDIWSKILIIIANILVFGQDILWFIRFDTVTGITFAPIGTPEHNGTSFSLNHPLFTVAIEGWFYIIAPFFLRKGLRVSLLIAFAGGLYHVFLYYGGYYQLGWSYFLFFSAIYFFFLGASSYHFFMGKQSAKFTALVKKYRPLTMAIVLLVLLLILAGYQLLPLRTGFYNMVGPINALFLALIIPALFVLTSKSAYDRFIGDLSFGIYIVHYPLLAWYKLFVPPEWLFRFTLLSSIVAAIIIYWSIDKPVDLWRQKRALAAKGNP